MKPAQIRPLESRLVHTRKNTTTKNLWPGKFLNSEEIRILQSRETGSYGLSRPNSATPHQNDWHAHCTELVLIKASNWLGL